MKLLQTVVLCLVVNICYGQQTEYVDFLKCKANINFDISQKKVQGNVLYTIKILKAVDSIYVDANTMRFMPERVRLFYKGMKGSGEHFGKIKTEYDGKKLWLYHKFKKNKEYKVMIRYFSNPNRALYFIDWNLKHDVTSSDSDSNRNRIEKPQIWTQGQGKYTSNWLPSIDNMNEKIEFDLSITFDAAYEVVANGNLTDKQINDSTITWHYDMKQPMPSYLVALAIGKYNKKVEHSKSGVPLEMHYYPEDSLKFEPTYRYTKEIFDYLEEEIGVPYPWQNYKMVPVKDFLYAGMENTSLNIYSDSFVVDSIAFVDKNFVNINAHELAHQWFGNLVTATSGTHHWLQEGFATYYALLAEKEVFGEDYYYWRLYEYAEELLAQDKAGQSTSLLDPKSSSTTFYKKGCWVLHMLREKVGSAAFKQAVKNYLEKYQFKNVETSDFISEVEKSSEQDMTEFVNTWLKSSELNYDEMEEFFYLTSIDYKGYFQLDCKNDLENCYKYVSNNDNTFLQAEVIKTLGDNVSKELLDNSKDLKLRQAIAQSLSNTPLELKEDYESLLNDESYITIETALFNLWKSFPEDRSKYLNKTKNIIGFNDKNVRMLWLTLALITEDYEPQNKPEYFQELTGYTSDTFGFEVRQNAFQYLHQIQACNDTCKENLKKATTHHNWRFKKFANSLLDKK
ncbi:M1 family peptidase [Hyunsoonleella flava]|uniref:Aminopeptidase N n=1 Tax=Hyunsoonleella flava TaxID=2527939 RepID=A0A4Q9FI65_9FLAO|nr:M1 family metallopeptidase [Hyunsoonleella flava]TBN06662.1 M1 family peptidase [Hyunsoonleella flava]